MTLCARVDQAHVAVARIDASFQSVGTTRSGVQCDRHENGTRQDRNESGYTSARKFDAHVGLLICRVIFLGEPAI